MYVAYIIYLHPSFHFRVCTCTYFDLARQTGGEARPLFQSGEMFGQPVVGSFFYFFCWGVFQFGCMHVCTCIVCTHTYL